MSVLRNMKFKYFVQEKRQRQIEKLDEDFQNNGDYFESLAPKDDIKDGNIAAYSALNFSLNLNNESVHNIAISGPFGAGKSSLWRSYKENKIPQSKIKNKIGCFIRFCLLIVKYPLFDFVLLKKRLNILPCKNEILDISLAKFDEEKNINKELDNFNCDSVDVTSSSIQNTKEENNKKTKIIKVNSVNDNQDDEKVEFEIEKAILQQMLFSVNEGDISGLNLNRVSEKVTIFNIILSLVLSFVFFLGINSFIEKKINESFCFLNYENIHEIVYIGFLGVIIVFSFFFVRSLINFIMKIRNIHVCNLSIKGIDLSFDQSNGSLLNQNYSAIVYFFEKTKKKVVAFEDLDRFSSNKIFVKLRELNTILNNCPSIKGPIKFVYMVKENLFTKYERTKFFEMIVPVIPVVNMESSADYLLRKKKEDRDRIFLTGLFQNVPFSLLNVDDKLLRIVGSYINDLRIIIDCINEFKIYQNQLREDIPYSQGIDNKIFAMIVYKNYYPQDFEDLHRRKSHLYNICKNYKYGRIFNEEEYLDAKKNHDFSLERACCKENEDCCRWIYWQCLKLELKMRYNHDDFNRDDKTDCELVHKEKLKEEEKRRRPSLIFDLIRNGYIDTNCEFYISRKYLGDLEISDWAYFVKIQSRGKPDFTLSIQKPRLLEKKILDYQWQSISVLNNRMFAYELLNSNNNDVEDTVPRDVIIRGLICAMQSAEEENKFFNQFVEFLDKEIEGNDIELKNERYTLIPNQDISAKKNLWKSIYENMDGDTLSRLFGNK